VHHPLVRYLYLSSPAGSFAAKLKPRSWRSSFTIAGLPNLSRVSTDPHDPHHAGSASSSYNPSTSVPGAAAVGGTSSGPPASMMRRMPTAGTGTGAATAGGSGGAAASAATSTSASPPSPGRDVPLAYSRHPYTLRTVTGRSVRMARPPPHVGVQPPVSGEGLHAPCGMCHQASERLKNMSDVLVGGVSPPHNGQSGLSSLTHRCMNS
jgi:hypothetical protein